MQIRLCIMVDKIVSLVLNPFYYTEIKGNVIFRDLIKALLRIYDTLAIGLIEKPLDL